MTHISKIIQRQQESGEPTRERKKQEPLPAPIVEKLWERMAMIYGHKWVSSYGEADDGTWSTGLYDVDREGLSRGLEALRLSDKEWPPSLPEFRELCKKPNTPFAGVTKRLPKPERNEPETEAG